VKHAGNPHAAAAGFVTDRDGVERDMFCLGDAPDETIQRNLAGGDFSEVSDFSFGSRIGEGDTAIKLGKSLQIE
jgi:hypothetical protein